MSKADAAEANQLYGELMELSQNDLKEFIKQQHAKGEDCKYQDNSHHYQLSKHRDLFADQPNLVLFSLVPDDMIALLKKLPLANEINIENKLSLREKQRAKRKA